MNIGPTKPKFHESYTPQPTPTPEQIKKLREDLSRAESEISRTREELRKVCEDFGVVGWDDWTPLPHVVKHYLGWSLYNDCTHTPGTHKCALCDEHSPDVVFGKSELLEEKTGNEGEAWVCQRCIEKARAEFYGQGDD